MLRRSTEIPENRVTSRIQLIMNDILIKLIDACETFAYMDTFNPLEQKIDE